MSISPEHSDRFAYQFVDIENLESILRNGLLCKTLLGTAGITPNSIASADIQRTRSQMPVTAGPGGVVHDYVPFYLCKRSTMLLSVVLKKNIDQQFLIYIAVPLKLVEGDDVVFTDAAANRANDPPRFYTDPQDLAKLDWATIEKLTYNLGDELNHVRMSELLIHQQLDPKHINHIVVWNSSIGDYVRELYQELELDPPGIVEDGRHYFSKWPRDSTASLVTGPHFTLRQYQETVDRLLKKIGKAKSARFEKLWQLRDALRKDLSAVAETGELDGLSTESGFHGDLGEHTRRVVKNLRSSDEFKRLSKVNQLLVEVAAFLHDIGKGPKSRWSSEGGKYKNDEDHPIAALPMVERILSKDVASLGRRSARIICKLVAYHDLIGGIVGKGRDPEQLLEVIDDEQELDMLIALTKADTLAVVSGWWNAEAVEKLRKKAVEEIENRDSEDEDA